MSLWITNVDRKLCEAYLRIVQNQTYMEKKYNAPEKIINYYEKSGVHHIVPYVFGLKFIAKHGGTIKDNNKHKSIEGNINVSLRDYQQQVYDYALEKLQGKKSILLELYTGSGKSLTSIAIALALGKRVLIVTTNVALASQWAKSMATKTNCSVGLVGPKGLTNKSADIVCTYSARINKLTEEEKLSFGTLIIDEVPYHCTEKYSFQLLQIQPEFVIGCTARLERANGLHIIGKLLIGSNIYTLKYTGPLTVCKYETGIIPQIAKNVNDDTMFSTSNATIYTTDYIHLLLEMSATLLNKGYKILLLFHIKESLDAVYAYFTENSNIIVSKFYEDMETYDDCQVLLGTYSKIKYGFDEEEMATGWDGSRLSAFILTDSMKDINAVEQAIGRILRSSNPVVIDMVHKHRIYENHYRERRKYYEEADEQGKRYKQLKYVEFDNIPELV